MELNEDELAFLEEMVAQDYEQELLQFIRHIEEEYATNPHYFSQQSDGKTAVNKWLFFFMPKYMEVALFKCLEKCRTVFLFIYLEATVYSYYEFYEWRHCNE